MYYLRTRPAVQAIQFTVDQTKVTNLRKEGQLNDAVSYHLVMTEILLDDSKI